MNRVKRLISQSAIAALLVVAAIVVISIKGVGTRHARASASTLVSVPYGQLPYPAGRMTDGHYLTLVDTRMYLVTREPFRAQSTPKARGVGRPSLVNSCARRAS